MADLTLPIILQIVQTVGILVGIVYYISIMNNTQKVRKQSLQAQEEAEQERKRDLIIQRSQTYNVDFIRTLNDILHQRDWKTGEEWDEKYGRTTNPEENSKWVYIMRTYSLAGVQLRQGVDPDLLFELYPYSTVIALWETFEPAISYLRRISNEPEMLEPLEFLYSEARKRKPDMTPGVRPQNRKQET